MLGRSIRIAAGSAAILLGTIAGAPAALAGEVTGNGTSTPIGEYATPASVCAFSGLNDVPDGSDSPGDPFAAGKVQSFGEIVQEFASSGPRTIKVMKDVLQENKPGVTCNKHFGGGH